MITPQEYIKNLQKKIITAEMLSDCIYSSNKRAKNYRDKQRQYRKWYTSRDYAGMAEEQKEKYYAQKDKLLELLTPLCIHRLFRGYVRKRIYDYEEDYRKHEKRGDFIYENRYFDEDEYREVWFGDILLEDQPRYEYFLYYEIGDRSFHHPISSEELKKYESLQMIDLDDDFETFGKDVGDLISNQFVNKVLKLVESGDYKLQLD